jgi:UDP-N-acetylglucosamine transferase subunit ALG13
MLSPAALRDLMSQSSVVVTHAGPATISLAQACGKRPVVVPRNPLYGEAVDDHQISFARHLAARGVVALAETEDDFHVAVDAALSQSPRTYHEMSFDIRETVMRIEAIVDDLVSTRTRPHIRDARSR